MISTGLSENVIASELAKMQGEGREGRDLRSKANPSRSYPPIVPLPSPLPSKLNKLAKPVKRVSARTILDILYPAIGRKLTFNIKELAGAKGAYRDSLVYTEGDIDRAVELIEDCIHSNSDHLRKATYPALFFRRVYATYLANLPTELPVQIWERVKYKGEKFRYNNQTKQWERRDDVVTQTT